MGLALHPDFPGKPYVYAMYSYSYGNTIKNKVIRLKHYGNYAKFDKVIIDGLLGAKYHDGGRIKFGHDRMLYICTGEQYVRSRAQNLNVLSGKILRLTPEGKIPSDNPFKNSPVYSYGHRNPQGITWHPKTKDMFQSEHGPSGELGRHKHDEINVIKKGGNYGWPLVIGSANKDKYIDPLVCWTDKATPPGGIAFYKGDLFVATMRSRCLVRIKMTKVNGKYKVTRIEKWFNDGKGNNKFGRLRDVVRGRDGYLYFTTTNRDGRGKVRSGDDKILRLRYK